VSVRGFSYSCFRAFFVSPTVRVPVSYLVRKMKITRKSPSVAVYFSRNGRSSCPTGHCSCPMGHGFSVSHVSHGEFLCLPEGSSYSRGRLSCPNRLPVSGAGGAFFVSPGGIPRVPQGFSVSPGGVPGVPR